MLHAIKAVLWSFFGIRKRADYEADQKRLTASQVIITGILCAMVFVIFLFFLVRFIVSR
jgi:hypothetical protein